MTNLHFINPVAQHYHEMGLPLASEATAAGVDAVAADPRLQACVDLDNGLETEAVPLVAALMIESLGTAAVLDDVRSLPGRAEADFEVGRAMYEEQVREQAQ